MILHLMAVLAQSYPNARDRHGRARRVRMIPATISAMLSTTSPVTAPPKISAGARVIFGVAALLENTPFELYTLIRSGSLIQLQAATRNASGDHEPTHDLEICRDLPRPSGLQDSPLEGVLGRAAPSGARGNR
jgi:hypothetical protein